MLGVLGKQRRSGLAALLGLVLVVSSVLGTTMVPRADAILANTGGSAGRFVSTIDWIDWSGATNTVASGARRLIRDDQTSVVWSTPSKVAEGIWRSHQCTISEVETHYEVVIRGKLYTYDVGIAVGYNVGQYSRDGLARLYNDGQNYADGVPKGNNYRSNLDIGVANGVTGVGGKLANAYFKIQCRAYLVSSSTQPAKEQIPDLPLTEIPVAGLVSADAESTNHVGAEKESVTLAPLPVPGMTSQDVSVRLLETHRAAGCTVNQWAATRSFPYPTGAKLGHSLTVDGRACLSGPTGVMLAANANGGYVEIVGGGVSAIAFGVVTAMDYGDAPATYGEAASVFQPEWAGGELGTDIPSSAGFSGSGPGEWYNLTAAEQAGKIASMAAPRVRLGAMTDADTTQYHSGQADGDDITGSPPDDEDGLGTWDGVIRTAPGSVWRQQVTCAGGGKVIGWVDWNRNGVFDPAEGSVPADCPGSGTATLEWNVPADVRRSVLGEPDSDATFMRLRTTADWANGDPVVPGPTGVTGTGEVEDHRVEVRVPMLTTVKQVDNSFADATGLTPDDWTISATQQGTVVASGTAGFAGTLVAPGAVNLSEMSSNLLATAYERTSLVCVPHPNSTEAASTSTLDADTQTVTMRGQDWMLCTYTNTAKSGEVTWTKLDQDGSTRLGGSSWTLSGPGIPAGTVVTDCISAPCITGAGKDQDPRAGEFKVTGLVWGTYLITEAAAPTGYEPMTGLLQFAPITATNLSSRLVAHPDGVINNRLTGTVTWGKTDENGDRLTGSRWKLTGPGLGGGIEVADCTEASDNDCPTAMTRDTDARPGHFRVTGLAWDDVGMYQLIETRAPVGYELDDTVHQFAITSDALARDFTDPFVNQKTTVPGLPLTGGAPADIFCLIGAGVLGLAGLIEAIRRRRSD